MISRPKNDVREAEAPADQAAIAKQRLTSSGSASVATSKSFGLEPEQQVAHAAADQERHEARILRR